MPKIEYNGDTHTIRWPKEVDDIILSIVGRPRLPNGRIDWKSAREDKVISDNKYITGEDCEKDPGLFTCEFIIHMLVAQGKVKRSFKE